MQGVANGGYSSNTSMKDLKKQRDHRKVYSGLFKFIKN
jgi:hypothetical protein